MYTHIELKQQVHRLIPSRFPPVLLFDWVDSKEELEQVAALEGLTNERILSDLGALHLVSKEDWVGGQGSTPLMASFTHIGHPSRFSDGSFGVYYAADSLHTAIKETMYHRERFYTASNEPPCSISMREYKAKVKKPLVALNIHEHIDLLNPNPESYQESQEFGRKLQSERQWGMLYPSVRKSGAHCVAVFRPPALTIPVQGCHLKYIWNGQCISEVYKESKLKNI